MTKKVLDHDEILRLYREGAKPREIADQFNVTTAAIYYALNKYEWKPNSVIKCGRKIQFHVPPSLQGRAESLAAAEEIAVTELMRRALREYLDNHQTPKERGERQWQNQHTRTT